jgi:hypothetical protein
MTENNFWKSLRKKLVPRVYALKLNVRYVAGIPDCWLSGKETDLWLELKYLKKVPPIVDPTKLLSTLQKAWLMSRHQEGRRVGVLIGSPDGHVYYPGLSWESSVSRGSFISQTMTTTEVANLLVDMLG